MTKGVAMERTPSNRGAAPSPRRRRTPAGLVLVAAGLALAAAGSAAPAAAATHRWAETGRPATSAARAPAPRLPHGATAGGYDLVGADGGVFVFPTGQTGGYYGSLPGLNPPVVVHDIVGIVASSDYQGYFLVGRDGGVFSFGDTTYEGSLPGIGVHVDDIVGIIASSDDRGYFLVGSDGGVFTFGDAAYEGSLPGSGIHVDDIVGIAATPDNRGYWLVGDDGSVYSYGDAVYQGGLVCPQAGACPGIASIVATSDGQGYWITDQDGDVYPFPEAADGNPTGSAGWFGDLSNFSNNDNVTDIVSLVPSPDDQGYMLVGADGGTFTFGDFAFQGSLPGLGLHVDDIVGAVPTA